ncbi:YraN family protein [Patescibacteria group bacterium]
MFFKKKNNLTVGKLGEKIAAKYLKKKGYKILELNFYNKIGRRLGEIDIIAKKEKKIIFVEVKTRELRGGVDVLPEESISRLKLRKLNKIALFYLSKKDLENAEYQFDAIAIWIEKENRNAKVRHLESIFF